MRYVALRNQGGFRVQLHPWFRMGVFVSLAASIIFAPSARAGEPPAIAPERLENVIVRCVVMDDYSYGNCIILQSDEFTAEEKEIIIANVRRRPREYIRYIIPTGTAVDISFTDGAMDNQPMPSSVSPTSGESH